MTKASTLLAVKIKLGSYKFSPTAAHHMLQDEGIGHHIPLQVYLTSLIHECASLASKFIVWPVFCQHVLSMFPVFGLYLADMLPVFGIMFYVSCFYLVCFCTSMLQAGWWYFDCILWASRCFGICFLYFVGIWYFADMFCVFLLFASILLAFCWYVPGMFLVLYYYFGSILLACCLYFDCILQAF